MQTSFPDHEAHPFIFLLHADPWVSPAGTVSGSWALNAYCADPSHGVTAELSFTNTVHTYMQETGKLMGLETQFHRLKVEMKNYVHSRENRACRIPPVQLPSILAFAEPQTPVTAPAPRPWPGPLVTAAGCHSLVTALHYV